MNFLNELNTKTVNNRQTTPKLIFAMNEVAELYENDPIKKYINKIN